MSKSHCLPIGAPVMRWTDTSLDFDDSEGDDGTSEAPEADSQILLLPRTTSASVPPPPRKRGKDGKPVDQLHAKTGEFLRRYTSQTDACNTMRISQIYVSECCRGARSEACGFKWRFSEDAPPEGPSPLRSIEC